MGLAEWRIACGVKKTARFVYFLRKVEYNARLFWHAVGVNTLIFRRNNLFRRQQAASDPYFSFPEYRHD